MRRTRQGNTGCQCQLRMVVSQLAGPTFDDSDQILQVCCEPMKFNRSRQETNTSNTCPVWQFVADETSTGVSNQKLELWVTLHPITREMGDEIAPFRSNSLPIRRYQPATPATVLEELPARLVVHFEPHWIRDTNHTAADQPRAASRQDNRDAEATISNSSLKHDHRQHGGDESTLEHAHVQLAKHA